MLPAEHPVGKPLRPLVCLYRIRSREEEKSQNTTAPEVSVFTLMLFADRTSTAFLRSIQLRLYFSSVAYWLMAALRRLGLRGTELAQTQCSTIRLKLLKILALIRVTMRKMWVSLAGG